jgi:predicted O-methyltransferase YrrM
MSPHEIELPKPRSLTAPLPKLLCSIAKCRFAPWFWGKEFTSDWVSAKIPVWSRVLESWRNRSIRILEIGSWEGRSALFFLRYFPMSRITCVDTFSGAADQIDNPQCSSEVSQIERRFDRNLAPYATRTEKLKNRSTLALQALADSDRQFELAYIDGSHLSADVMDDSMRVWPLVVHGGVIIWDDYDWGAELPSSERPQPAIDQFLHMHPQEYRTLVRGNQMIVQRL